MEPFIVPDARNDPRFNRNPLVVESPNLRFYAGVPLRTEDGLALGSLAVMDRVPRVLSDAQLATLTMLAEQVMAEITLRRQRRELEKVAAERDRSNAALRNQAKHLREAQRIAEVGSWELEIARNEVCFSEETSRILGLTPENASGALALFMSPVHPEDREALMQAMHDAQHDGAPLDMEYRIVRHNGEVCYVRNRAQRRTSDEGRAILAGTLQDITALRKSQEHLHLLETSISRIDDIVMITEAEPYDEPGPRIVFVNDAFERHTGYAAADVLGRSPRLLQGPKTQRSELDRIREALVKKQPVSAELINYTRSGKEFWLETSITPVIQASGKSAYFVAVQRDITDRKAAEQEIERLAFFDPLTRLPNRRLLLDRLQHAMTASERNGHPGAVLFIDLDNFKSLNDTLGHDMGDCLLQQVARRLETCARRNNTVARLGGDEFVVMLEDLSGNLQEAAAQAETVGERIIEAIGRPFSLDGHEQHCTPSIGITLFSNLPDKVDDLLKRADLAMYEAKAAGRNTIRFYDPEMQAAVTARVRLESDIRRALQGREFFLHYQPQVDADGHVAGVEALLRWRNPNQGWIPPSTFIPLAEETGLIKQLGSWVLETACLQLASWASKPATAHLNVTVNVSARQFRQPDFETQVMTVLERTGANPRHLKLELTESVFLDSVEDTIAKMMALKEKGVGFSLDDFGTGYSSLSYLRRLPLDQLKIDQSFVRQILVNASDAAIARTIVTLGHTLGFEVIAEGVESKEQRDFLEQQGCRIYQGYLFGQPLPAEQFQAAG
jgi:diguanylate cyclase (GGDEF)-like protein/PAS domain S-box-containing protein